MGRGGTRDQRPRADASHWALTSFVGDDPRLAGITRRARELLALVRWTNALGPLLELSEPIDVTRLGADGEALAGALESAGIVAFRDASECLACGGWDGHHLEAHAASERVRVRMITGRPEELMRWIIAALAERSWRIESDGTDATLVAHAIEHRVSIQGRPVTLRVAIGGGEPPLALAPGERVLRLRLGAAPPLRDPARVVDVDAARLLDDEDERRRVLRALERTDVVPAD